MDYSQLTDVIQNVGFPIFMCLLLIWYMINQRKEHKEEIEKMTSAINNNTVVLTELVTLMKGRDDA